MSPEYWYTDREAAGVEDSLRAAPAEREHAARMIGLQRRVITELRSRRDAQEIRVAALEESLRAEKERRHTLDCDLVKHPNCTRCNCQ